MAKLSSYRRILDQDFDPQYKSLISNLGIIVNSAFEELYDSLNGKITFRDNISCTIAEFKVTVDIRGTPVNKTQVALSSTQTTVEGLWVIDASGAADPSILPVAAPFVSFVKNNNSIIIQNIKGLQAGVPYRVKVLVIG